MQHQSVLPFERTPGDRFAELARDFFARLTYRSLDYFLSRELANHTGQGRRFTTDAERMAFQQALAQHTFEASRIVQEFSGGCFGKTVWQQQALDRAAINRFGFNNDGAEAIAARLAARPKGIPVGLNLGANKDSDDRSEDFARVLARWFAIDQPVDAPATKKVLWSLAGKLVPRSGPGDWNQALMELGFFIHVEDQAGSQT